jgi:hypothetical protein
MPTMPRRVLTLVFVLVPALAAASCGDAGPVGSASHPTEQTYRSWGEIDRAHPGLARAIAHAFGDRFAGISMNVHTVPTVRRVYVVDLTSEDRATLDEVTGDVAHRHVLENALYSRREVRRFACIARGAIPDRFEYYAAHPSPRGVVQVTVFGDQEGISEGLLEAGLPADAFYIDFHPDPTPVPGCGKPCASSRFTTHGRTCIWPPPPRGSRSQPASPDPSST